MHWFDSINVAYSFALFWYNTTLAGNITIKNHARETIIFKENSENILKLKILQTKTHLILWRISNICYWFRKEKNTHAKQCDGNFHRVTTIAGENMYWKIPSEKMSKWTPDTVQNIWNSTEEKKEFFFNFKSISLRNLAKCKWFIEYFIYCLLHFVYKILIWKDFVHFVLLSMFDGLLIVITKVFCFTLINIEMCKIVYLLHRNAFIQRMGTISIISFWTVTIHSHRCMPMSKPQR